MPRHLALAAVALAPGALALAAVALTGCFAGEALLGEPCLADSDCGPRLQCAEGGLCGEFRCPATPISLPTFAPDITLVVAYTASMARTTADDLTRWQQVQALVGQLGAALGDRIDLGIQLVPSLSAQSSGFFDPCYTSADTGLLPAAAQGQAILDLLPASPPALGEHALRAGLELALAGFLLQDPDDLRPQAVVLLSDAPFNCSEAATNPLERVELFDGELIPRVTAAAATGVPVFVVGVGVTAGTGSEPFDGAQADDVDPHLAFNALADAGGQPRSGAAHYYRPEDIDALITALAAVPPAFADCRVDLEAAPAYPDRLVITIGAARHHGQPDCAAGHGWRYPDPGVPTTVELCPATCADFRATRALTIEQRCPAVVP